MSFFKIMKQDYLLLLSKLKTLCRPVHRSQPAPTEARVRNEGFKSKSLWMTHI